MQQKVNPQKRVFYLVMLWTRCCCANLNESIKDLMTVSYHNVLEMRTIKLLSSFGPQDVFSFFRENVFWVLPGLNLSTSQPFSFLHKLADKIFPLSQQIHDQRSGFSSLKWHMTHVEVKLIWDRRQRRATATKLPEPHSLVDFQPGPQTELWNLKHLLQDSGLTCVQWPVFCVFLPIWIISSLEFLSCSQATQHSP